uniref:Uncharacterized protein n=1 Tax=viral metagenome TaxID=1070528 RepID=A0A6C0LDC2_9ZZZZ
MSNIPNTLTIFINTRIRGYPKIKYSPNMTIPDSKSDSVYFDPLVKLNTSVVKAIPAYYPKKDVYTQFFNKTEFSGLIKRTISSTAQKTVDLVQATENGYVDANIDIILQTLFSPNTLFYIKDQPFTIFSYDWLKGDWRIDTKKFENRMLYSPYGSRLGSLLTQRYGYGQGYGQNQQTYSQQQEADKQLAEFKKKYPAQILNGYSTQEVSSHFADTRTAMAQAVAQGQVVSPQKKTFLQQLATHIPSSFHTLIGRDFVPQSSINVDTTIRDIPSDPISLSILYNISDNYEKDIQMNPELLQSHYDNLKKAAQTYKESSDQFTNVLGTQLPSISVATPVQSAGAKVIIPDSLKDKSVMSQKLLIDQTAKSLKDLINQYKKKRYSIDYILQTPTLKTEFSNVLSTWVVEQKIFYQLTILALQCLLEKIENMMEYISMLETFYRNLYQVKKKQGGTAFQIELIDMLFKFDLNCYQAILQSATIKSYISSVKLTLKNKEIRASNYLKIIYNSKEEMTKNYQYPDLFKIQLLECNIAALDIILMGENFELSIWDIIKSKSTSFLTVVRDKTFTSVGNTKTKMDAFQRNYSQADRTAFDVILKAKGEPMQKQTPLFFESTHTKLIKTMTNEYLSIQTGIITSYDFITLYSRVSTVVFAREIAFLTCKKNINNTLLEIHGTSGYQTYYSLIYANPTIVSVLPVSMVLFDGYPTDATIMGIIALNNQKLDILNQRKLSYATDMPALQKKYTDSVDLLIPQISSVGMLQQCLGIMTGVIPPIANNNNNDDDFMQSKYDPNGTDEFRRELFITYEDGINDGLLTKISEDLLDEMVEEWKLYGDPYDICNSLFTSISIAFNRGLLKADKITNNRYSENGLYTAVSLRNAVAEYITATELVFWDEAKQYTDYSPDDPDRIPYNFLFDENNLFIGDDLQKVKAAIRLEPKNGGKYCGNQKTIQILESIFKVKMITIQAETIPIDKKILSPGQIVHFEDVTNEYKGTILSRTKKRGSGDEYSYSILLEDHTVVRDISREDIIDIDTSFFSISCSDSQENLDDADEFTHYVVLMQFGTWEDPIKNYQVAYNTKVKQCVFQITELPPYIIYLLFKGCWRSKILLKTALLPDQRNWYYTNTNMRAKLNRGGEAFRKMLSQKITQQNIIGRREAKKEKDRFRSASRAPSVSQQRGPSSGGSLLQQGGAKPVLSVPNKNLYVDINNMNALYNNIGVGDSKLTYYIVIDLELYPGEKIPMGEKAVLACQSRYEKIRQAYAQLFGIQYQPNEFSRGNFVAPDANAKSKKKQTQNTTRRLTR